MGICHPENGIFSFKHLRNKIEKWPVGYYASIVTSHLALIVGLLGAECVSV